MFDFYKKVIKIVLNLLVVSCDFGQLAYQIHATRF